MGIIKSGIVPSRKVDVKVVKEGPVTVLGNTYLGKIHKLNINTAARLVNAGICEFTDPKEYKKLNLPVPGSDETEYLPQTPDMNLQAALDSLDPAIDAHWTQQGLPDLNALKELTGTQVKRAEVQDAAPDFHRESAQAAKAE